MGTPNEGIMRLFFDKLRPFRLGKKRILLGVGQITGGLALLFLFCAISMDSWLFTVERELDASENGTLLITLHSGLWRVCKRQEYLEDVGKNTMWIIKWLVHDYHSENCSYIPYFQNRKKDAGELKPTESVLSSMRPAPFFVLCGIFLLAVSGGLGSLSLFRQRSRRLVFMSGGTSIVSGISTLIGIVLYVGSVSQSFDSISVPLRVETRYYYSFGAAFRLCIAAFMLSEFSGVFVIYLFLAELRHRHNQSAKPKLASYRFVNSISTDLLTPSRIPTAATSIAQISLAENCLLKQVQSNESNPSPLRATKKTHAIVANHHPSNPCRVKVISYITAAEACNNVTKPALTSHSLESLGLTNSGLQRVVVNKRTHRPLVSSANLRRLRGLPGGNARSALNIRAEEVVPDFVWQSKSTRASKQMLYSCRECEHLVVNQSRNHRNMHTPSVRSGRTAARSQISNSTPAYSTSSTCSDSSMSDFSSLNGGSVTEDISPENVYYDGSGKHCSKLVYIKKRFSGNPKPGGMLGSNNEVSSSITFQKSEDITNSESVTRNSSPTEICQCPGSSVGNKSHNNSVSGFETPQIVFGELNHNAMTKKHTRHKQKITSV